jgi:hypothetical protein
VKVKSVGVTLLRGTMKKTFEKPSLKTFAEEILKIADEVKVTLCL